jgi:hypothetical protein
LDVIQFVRGKTRIPGQTDLRLDCPGSPGMSTSPGPIGAADRTFIRVYLLLSVAKKLCLPFSICRTA